MKDHQDRDRQERQDGLPDDFAGVRPKGARVYGARGDRARREDSPILPSEASAAAPDGQENLFVVDPLPWDAAVSPPPALSPAGSQWAGWQEVTVDPADTPTEPEGFWLPDFVEIAPTEDEIAQVAPSWVPSTQPDDLVPPPQAGGNGDAPGGTPAAPPSTVPPAPQPAPAPRPPLKEPSQSHSGSSRPGEPLSSPNGDVSDDTLADDELAELRARAIFNSIGEFDPFGRGPVAPLAPIRLSNELRALVRARVPDRLVASLADQVSELFREVERDLSRNRNLTYQALQKLNEARIMLLTDKGLYPDAELRVEEVRIMLQQARSSTHDAQRWAPWILGVNILLLLGLMALLISDRFVAQWLASGGIAPGYDLPLRTETGDAIPLSMAMYFAPWFTMLWGGVGGTIGALVDFLRYRERREYDIEYNSRYFVYAIVGVALGAAVYFLFISGFFLVGAISQNSDVLDPVNQVLTATSPLLILIAIGVGIAQNTVYKMLDRVIRTYTDEDEVTAQQTVTTSASTSVKAGQ